MAGRDLVPSVNRNTPLITEKVATPTRNPVLGGVQTPVVDPTLRTSGHEVDHQGHIFRPTHETEDHMNPLKPVSLKAQATARHRPGGDRDRHFFSSDDSALNKQIQVTHAPDMDEVDVRPVLSIVEDILRLARPKSHDEHALTAAATANAAAVTTTAALPGSAHVPAHVDHTTLDKTHAPTHGSYQLHDDHRKVYEPSYVDSEIVRVLAYPINKVSCEIICKCAGGGESHLVTMDLLKSLSSYTWDAKVVIAFAAFSIHYGEFWLVEHHHTQNPLAKNIAILKDLPEIMAQSNELRKQFEAVLDLLTAILKVTHCIIEFKELPPMYISPQSPEITAATAHIPTAVYWCIRGLLVCASTLLSLIGGGHEYTTSTSVSWEILNLAHKLSVILEHLHEKMRICRELVERKRAEDLYAKFKRLLESAHIDNMKVLNAIFRPRDGRPLYDGSRNSNERLEVLRQKYVLLLISDLDLPPEELHVLHLIHGEHSMRHEYEILWLPVADPLTPLNEMERATFTNLRRELRTTMASGDKLIPTLDGYYTWGSEVDHPDNFVPVLDRVLKEYHPEHHCHRLILPGQAGYIPERVVCSECGKIMDKYVMYRCCTD